MQIFDSYIDAGQQLPQRDKERFYTALIEFIAYGFEPNLDGAAAAVFTAIKPSLVISKKRAEAGRRGGNANAKNNGSSNFASKQNESKSEASDEASEQLACEFAHTITNTITSKGVGGAGEGEPNPFTEAEEADAGFAWQCLAELNAALGLSYSTMPAKCSRTLSRFEGKYDLSSIRRMVEFKRDEWAGTQYARHLTPNTLFSPDHFEQYMEQSSKEAGKNARFDKYR